MNGYNRQIKESAANLNVSPGRVVEDARERLRGFLAEYPTITTATTNTGDSGSNGHRVELVRVLILRDWNGTPEPIDVTGEARDAIGGIYSTKHRGGSFGLAIQSGGLDPQDAVYAALVEALGVEEWGRDNPEGVRHNRAW